MVPRERIVVAADQAGRVPRVLRTYVRRAQGAQRAEGGAGVRMVGRCMVLTILLAMASGTPTRAQTPETPADSRAHAGDERVVEAAQAQPEVPSPFQLRQTPQLVSQPGAVDPTLYRLGPGHLLQLGLRRR